MSNTCGRLSWLPVSFLLHVKYTLLYRIIQLDSYVLCCENRSVYLYMKNSLLKASPEISDIVPDVLKCLKM